MRDIWLEFHILPIYCVRKCIHCDHNCKQILPPDKLEKCKEQVRTISRHNLFTIILYNKNKKFQAVSFKQLLPKYLFLMYLQFVFALQEIKVRQNLDEGMSNFFSLGLAV